jgi:hypothetical protein
MSSRGVAWPVAAAFLSVTLEFAAGCRAVIGADEFSVGERLEPCGELEVRDGQECVAVGVRDCGDGFSADDRGGCEPILPSAPCEPGTYARPGLTVCSNLDLGCSSAQGQFGLITDPVGPIVYVGGTPASGTRFDTIAEALGGTTGDVTIALAEGSHTANVEITGRRVQIVGICPEITSIVAGDSKPVIKVGPGGDGSRFERFAITGKGPGLVVSSASDVKVLGLWLHDLGGAGVMFDDVAGWAVDDAQYRKTSGSIERSLVEGATDVGVAIYGAEVRLSELQIANTRPVREGHRALGLSARASPYFTLPNGLPLEQARRPSTISANRVLIEGGRGAGVLLEGARATLESVIVRRVESDLARHGRGIDVRAHVPGRVPTTLVMRHSLIENVFDVGLRSWNADSVVVEDSVIRDVGEAMTGRCLGNGVRARYDLLRDTGLENRLVLRHSLIERTRQAGVLVEGGNATIEGSLVRDTRSEPCRNDYGDGVAVHASATGPSSTVLRRTRIERAARAGVSSFRSNTSLESVMVACGEFGLAATGPAMAIDGAVCGCKNELSTCPMDDSLGPSLIGGAECDAGDATACYRGCSGTLLQDGSVLEEATAWVYDHDEIVSVLSNDKGCYDVEGLPPNEPALIAIAHDKHVSGLGMMAPLESDSPAAYSVNLVQPTLLSAGAVIFGSTDLRATYLMQMRVCSDPKEPRVPGAAICKGLPGLTASIEPGPAGPPIYFSTVAFPDATLKETLGADLAFHGVVPGEHAVTLHAPSGSSVDCRPDTGGFGWTTSQADRFRVLGEEGFPTMLGAEVNCRVTTP